LLIDARLTSSRGLLHRVAHARVQVAYELVEDLLLRREVEIEGPLPHTGRFGDLHDRRVVIAELAENGLGGLEQPEPGFDSARGEGATVGTGNHVGHCATSETRSCFWIFPRPLRGISATKRTEAGTLNRARRATHQ